MTAPTLCGRLLLHRVSTVARVQLQASRKQGSATKKYRLAGDFAAHLVATGHYLERRRGK